MNGKVSCRRVIVSFDFIVCCRLTGDGLVTEGPKMVYISAKAKNVGVI